MIDKMVALDTWLGEDKARFGIILAIVGFIGAIMYFVTRGTSINLYYAYIGILGVATIAIGGLSLLLYIRKKRTKE